MNGGSVVFDQSVGGNAFTVGGLAGTGGLSLQNNATAPVALSVGNNNATTFYSGILSGNGSLVKTGSGTLALGAPARSTGPAQGGYFGSTTVSQGTPQLAYPIPINIPQPPPAPVISLARPFTAIRTSSPAPRSTPYGRPIGPWQQSTTD